MEAAGFGGYEFRVLEFKPPGLDAGQHAAPEAVFLHGFLGCADDWIPLASALSASLGCGPVSAPGEDSQGLRSVSLGCALRFAG